MNQEQYQWLKDNGYDPAVYDVDEQGNVFENPVNAAQPQKEVMSKPRAFGTSFAGSVLPTAGGLAASAPFIGLSIANPLIGIPALIASGMAGGYGTGKLQEAALERFAPEALQELSRAQTDQPVMSYLGGFAPSALAFRPSFGGVKGLTAPLMSGSEAAKRAAFIPAAINVGANVAGAGAGELLNVAEGGEFSAPRFAASAALGSLFSKPTFIGRKMGFPALGAEVAAPERLDLAGRRGELAAAEAARADEAASARATELLGGETKPVAKSLDQIVDPRRANIEENRRAIEKALTGLTKEQPPVDLVQDLANDPFVGNLRDDPAALQEFIFNKADKYLQQAFARGELTPEFTGQVMGAMRERAGAFTPEGGVRVAPADWTPPSERITRQPATTEEVLGRTPAVQEGTPLEQALKPTPEEVAKADKIQAENARIEAEQNAAELQKLQDLEAAQALSDEAAARLEALQARQAELLRLAERAPAVIRRGVAEQGAPDIAQAKQELADARAIADDLVAKLQRAGGEGQITQADLDAAAQLAARRGLKIEFTTPEQQAQGIRGAYLTNKAGERVIYIDANAATPDTAIHEIGHDVFERSAGQRMKRSLMQTAEGSEAYKREYAARLAEVDKNGQRVNTDEQAHNLALEEGVIQAFGEAYPNVPRGEIRAWFNALKASLKSMVGMKLSPEDAARWLHYATTELVPWKGAVAVKTGEERMQRRQEPELSYDYLDKYIKKIEDSFDTSKLSPEDIDTYLELFDPKDAQAAKELLINNRLQSTLWSWADPGSKNFNLEKVAKEFSGFGTPHQNTAKYYKLLAKYVPDFKSIMDEVRALKYSTMMSELEKSPDIRYQRAQQETPEFKNWFGDSKVVDEQGKPLVVYHGTSKDVDFTSFKGNKNGIWFTPDPKIASDYAAQNDSMGYRRGVGYSMEPTNTASRVIPAYVSLKNPAKFDVWPDVIRYATNYKKALGDYFTQLKAQGHDGVIFGSGKDATYVAFNPEQIKSATANRGTFSPESKDIRYQRGLTGKAAEAVKTGIDKTLPEIDQITRRGGIYETVGRALTRMYNTAQSMFGRSQAIAPEIYKLSDADAIKLTRHLLQEHRTRTRITPAPEITAAYNEWRNTVKRFWVDENNAVGNTIRQGTGVRERLSDEFWLPFHKESDDVRKILSERVGTPEYQKLKDDYVREATDSYLQKGMNQQDARNKAIADFENERSVILAPFDPSAPATFAGARKPQGRPLPESWGELNFRDLLESYNRRSAKDYAAQMALERSPEVMTALGSQKMHNDQPIPAAILQNTPIISTDPSVQSVMREFSGRPLQTPGKFVRGVGSVASALALQTISRIGDIGGTVVKPLAYVGLGDYATYMSGMADKLSNWSQLQLRSIESGLNNPNAHQNFRQAISVGDDAGKYMRRFVDSIGSLTLSNKLEEVARTLAQAQGEMIVSINKRRAATGDKEAIRFLDTLNPDWRTTGDTDLGGQFGLLMQGSYDMRQLPAWFLESGAAPYLTWSKWSMSQLNNFRKFAVEPAMQGDLKPLIAQLLIGMAGGGAIEEIQEWLSNKESKAINWSELQSWAEQNQGEIGSDGGQLLMQKLLMMAQKTGTFGFAGDLMLLPVNALVGDTQGVIGAYPALELTTDLAKNIGGALGAIDKGEDVGLVLKRFGKNMIVGKTQVLRVIGNWADELENEGAENLRSADRRKQRLFDELNGMSRAGMFPVSYDNLNEQEFERGRVTEETGEEAFELVSKAREEATSREDYASRIRKLKTSQNQIMPSLERQPMKAARYLSFVEGAEEGAGAETMRRYMIREQENKYRKSLIEGLSGLR